MMPEDNIFSKVGKRMPYTVPDDFFAGMQADILAQIKNDDGVKLTPAPKQFDGETAPAKTSRTPILRRWLKYGLGAAAAVTLFFSLGRLSTTSELSAEYLAVQSTFDDLNPDDQQYLYDLYQSDMFLAE